MEFGNLEVFYSDNVAEKYVTATGKYFEENDLILDKKHSIKLTSNHSTYVLKMILAPELDSLPQSMQNNFTLLEEDIKREVFPDIGSTKVNFEIEVCDVNFYPIKLKN
jgi:hypothetical protein